MGRKLEGLPALRCAVVALVVASAVLVGAPVGRGQEPAPAVTVPVDSGSDSGPAPAPDPAPSADAAPPSDASGGGSGSNASPAPSAEPPAEAPDAGNAAAPEQIEAGPSAEERAKEKKRKQAEQQRREQQEEAPRERERAASGDAVAATTQSLERPLAGGAVATRTPVASVDASASPISDDVVATPETPEAAPTAVVQAAAFSEGSESSSLPGATPLLASLLALSIVLLGLAVVPPWRIRAAALAGLVAGRRFELGLVGAAVLASAIVGLLVVLSG